MFLLLLAVAGNETTRNAIAARHARALEQPRPVRQSSCDDPDAASTRPSRRSCAGPSPVLYFRRTATADTELARPGRSRRATRSPSGTSRPTATRTCSTTRSRSTSSARPTTTSPSAAAARTSAWAPTSPAWSSACSSRSCSSACPTSTALGDADRAALQLHRRHQAPAGRPQRRPRRCRLGRRRWPLADLPLAGVRVVETCEEKGELCGRLLADLGADVVKVEPPGGASSRRLPPFAPDGTTSLWFAVRNSNKRSVELDVVAEPDRFQSLLAGADVWLESSAAGCRSSTRPRWQSVTRASSSRRSPTSG